MKTPKEALATHLGWDISDLTDYNYQPGKFTKVVYALESGYYCATKSNKLPQPIYKNKKPFKWVEIKDDYVNKYGYKIFKCNPDNGF